MPIGLGAAIVGSSLISGASSYLGGKKASEGADKALELEAYRIAQLKPFLDAGKQALPQYQQGIEDIPTMQDLIGYAQRDPGLQFQREQGLQAIEGSAAARGNLLSGNTLKALTEYGQGIASQGLDTALNRAMTLQGTRQNQLQNLMSSGLVAGGRNALPQLAMQQGLTQQGMYSGIGDALQGGLSNFMFANLAGMYNKKPPGLGGMGVGLNAGTTYGGHS